MRMDVVRADETLEQLAARLDVPACMLLRANRIFSAAWLTPGREIAVPDLQYCRQGEGQCPLAAACCPALPGPGMLNIPVLEGDTFEGLARRHAVPQRILRALAESIKPGQILRIHAPERARLHTVGVGDTLSSLARAHQISEDMLAQINVLSGPLYPGMAIWIPIP